MSAAPRSSGELPGVREGRETRGVEERPDAGEAPHDPLQPWGPTEERVEERLRLLEREGELVELLRRTRFTVPVWVAAVVYFLWAGWATGSWPPAVTLAACATVAGGVNRTLRRRRVRELDDVRAELEALPPAPPA